MAFTDERTGLEIITLAECVQLLESKEVARVAFTVDGTVHLYPVNYVWDGEGIVFRCEPNGVMARALGTEFVAEIDHIEERDRRGWSVIARGVPEAVDPTRTPQMAERLQRLALYPWVGGDKELWVRMIPAPLTGRRAARIK